MPTRTTVPLLLGCAILTSGGCSKEPPSPEPLEAVELPVDGTGTTNASLAFQTIEGFGVNIDPTNWGTDGSALRPVLDRLVDDLGATMFRIGPQRMRSDWEVVNDNANPAHWNPAADSCFETQSYRQFLGVVRYLNSKGITDIIVGLQGRAPDWLGGTYTQDGRSSAGACLDAALAGCNLSTAPTTTAEAEAEFVETTFAFLQYSVARAPEPKPIFRWYSPINEPDCAPAEPGEMEGVHLAPEQGARILDALQTRMDQDPVLRSVPALGGEPIRLIGSGVCGAGQVGSWRAALQPHPNLWSKLAAVDHHGYKTGEATTYGPAGPDAWLTEFGDPGKSVNNQWLGAWKPTWSNGVFIQSVVRQWLVQGDIRAALVWDAYDNFHSHAKGHQTYGLLQTNYRALPSTYAGRLSPPASDAVLDGASYSKKPAYYALQHLFRFVRKGARRIHTSAAQAVAFLNPDQSVVQVGYNSGAAGAVSVTFTGLHPMPASMALYTTSANAPFQGPTLLDTRSGRAAFELPAGAFYTLVSAAHVRPKIISPVEGSYLASGTLNLTATATSFGVTVDTVAFYEGYSDVSPPTPLCLATLAGGTYSCTAHVEVDGKPHRIQAIATDGGGVHWVSDPTTVWLAASSPIFMGDPELQPRTETISAGRAMAFPMAATVTGPVDTLHLWLDRPSGSSTTVHVGLYDDKVSCPIAWEACGPALLLGTATISGSSAGWNAARLETPVRLTVGTFYWVVVLAPAGTGTVSVRDRGTSGYHGFPAFPSSSATLTTVPSTYASGTGNRSIGELSAYFTASGTLPTSEPTVSLGNTTVGPDTSTTAAGKIEAYQYLATPGTVARLWIYVPASSAATRLDVGLYSQNGSGKPQSRTTFGTSGPLVKGAWNAIPVPPVQVTATHYYLAILSPNGGGASTLARTSGATNRVCTGGAGLRSLPGTFPYSVCGVGSASAFGSD